MIDDQQQLEPAKPVSLFSSPQEADQAEYRAAAGEHLREGSTDRDVRVDVLGHSLLGEFAQAENERRETEIRWLRDLRNYRGQYDAATLEAIGPARAKTFVRKTRVKIKTVDSRVADLLFPTGTERNWAIQPTPKPSISKEQKRELFGQMAQALGREPQRLEFEQAIKEISDQAAKAMTKVIDDQLAEARYKAICLQAMHSGHLYGTGVVKGPLVERRIRTRYVKQGGRWVAKTESYVIPFVDQVPIWRFYPDMNATTLEQCRYVYERHTMTRHELAELAKRKSFRAERIREFIKARPDGEVTPRYFDNEIRQIGDRYTGQGAKAGMYEVLERWGYLSGEQLREAGVKVEDERCHETFFSNVWLLPNGEIIKAVLQPINGVTWPYHLYYFDKDETSIFGEGLASIMADDQDMINACVRMMLDNGAITSGPQLEVAVGLLAGDDDPRDIRPWRVWLRNGNNPGQPAVRSVDLQSRLPELSGMAQMFETNADEVTAVPRYMNGENATQGAAGTSSGLSMLMAAVNIVIKDLITNWDEGVTESFIKALYRWNMQFHPDDQIKGDYDVVASGTASLVAREVRARMLAEFGATTGNPLDAPYVKRDALLRQRAEALELVGVVKTEDEVKQEMANPAAQQQQQMQQQVQQAQMAEMQAKVQALMAQAAKVLADADLIKAKAVGARVESAYAAMQAAGAAVSTPGVAAAGDEILRSSGWQDATPQTPMSQLPPGQPGPQGAPPADASSLMEGARPPTAGMGERQGIRTVNPMDGAAR